MWANCGRLHTRTQILHNSVLREQLPLDLCLSLRLDQHNMTDTSELIRIYDCKGIAMDVPACPPAETDWTMVSSDGSTRGDHQPLLTEIEGVLHQRVARWKVLALHAKLVSDSGLVLSVMKRLDLRDIWQILQVELEDESTVVARKLMDKEHLLRFQIIKDECDVRNLQDMLHSEARVLRWLEKSTTLPIPRVMHPLDNIEGADFILQAMLPGETLLNSWSKLSVYAKVGLITYLRSQVKSDGIPYRTVSWNSLPEHLSSCSAWKFHRK